MLFIIYLNFEFYHSWGYAYAPLRWPMISLLWLGFLSGIPILLYTLYFVGLIIWNAF